MIEPSIDVIVGSRIGHYRAACGLTISQLALLCELSEIELVAIESGRRRPRSALPMRLAVIVGVPVVSLFMYLPAVKKRSTTKVTNIRVPIVRIDGIDLLSQCGRERSD
jgi:transcriptional regulator with XRE-family HTH domain